MSVRYALLGLLSQRPRHGYELRAAFSAFVGGDATWEVKPSQVYTTLKRLEHADLIQPHQNGPDEESDKTVYAINPLGQAELHEWLSTGVSPHHLRDEFFIKMMLALALEDADPERILRTQRARIFKELHSATTQRDSLDPRSELAHKLLMDKAIMHLEADLRWLEFVEARLDEIISQPLPEPEIRPRGRPPKHASGSSHPPPEDSI